MHQMLQMVTDGQGLPTTDAETCGYLLKSANLKGTSVNSFPALSGAVHTGHSASRRS
jgi:hypothetical protein